MQQRYTIITYLLGINPILKRHGQLSNIHLVRTMCKKRYSEFIINNGTITDPAKVANEFNKYFVSIGQTLSRNVQTNRSYDEYLEEKTNCQLVLTQSMERLWLK